jgi:hypothetical protein
MPGKFEVIINRDNLKNNNDKVVIDKAIPIEKNVKEAKDDVLIRAIDEEVKKYLKNIETRDDKGVKEILKQHRGVKQNSHILRTPEAGFQNSLLRIMQQQNLAIDRVSYWIKTSLVKYKKENSINIQLEIDKILAGVESCNQAIAALQKEMQAEHPDKEVWIATNDEFDARYQIDLLAGIEKKDRSIEILRLVQVKSNHTDADQETIQNVTQTHQHYIATLPQLIGMLNKKEADMHALDIDRRPENVERLTFLGLALDEYSNKIKNLESVSAVDFYEYYKKEGGVLNPFALMGILKNQKVINGFRTEDPERDKKIEERLAKTADEIPYTQAESIAFHKTNHLHTILNSAKITSVVMVKGEKVSEKELKFNLK